MSAMTCSVEGCGKAGRLTGGMCSMHYTRLKRHGQLNPTDGRMNGPARPLCDIDGCERTAHGQGLCLLHYKRVRRHGDPLQGRHRAAPQPPARCRVKACSDAPVARRYCQVHYDIWSVYGTAVPRVPRKPKVPKRYRVVLLPEHPLAAKGGTVLHHRVVLFEKIGSGAHPCHWCGRPLEWLTGREAARGIVVDHLDHDRLNNDPTNLVPSCDACNGHRVRGEQWTPWQPGDPVRTQSVRHQLCRRGHELTPDNVYVRPSTGNRRCRECIKIGSAKQAERRRIKSACLPYRNFTTAVTR